MKKSKIISFTGLLIAGYLIAMPINSATYKSIINDDKNQYQINYSNQTYLKQNDPSNGINLYLVKEISDYFSNIIYQFDKGRSFGTTGENEAANTIYSMMVEWGLQVTRERLHNIEEDQCLRELTHKLEVTKQQLIIHTPEGSSYEVDDTDYFISPQWKGNDRHVTSYLDQDVDYNNLKIIPVPEHILSPPYFIPYVNCEAINEDEDFMFISEDTSCNPKFNLDDAGILKPLYKFCNEYGFLSIWGDNIMRLAQSIIWKKWLPHCKGLIIYDFNDDLYDMVLGMDHHLPTIYINGSLGKKIIQSIEDKKGEYRLDLQFSQRYNTSVVSENIYGEIKGKTDEVIIISSLYDGWYCEAAGDSGLGMAIVLALADYFARYYRSTNITPDATIRFCAFAGEEYGFRGAKYHEYVHRNENITYLVDVNQVCIQQTRADLHAIDGITPEQVENALLSLKLISNDLDFLNFVWSIAKKSNYYDRVDHLSSVDDDGDKQPDGMERVYVNIGDKVCKDNNMMLSTFGSVGAPSNDRPFAQRDGIKTLCFLKDTNNHAWIYHHRGGGRSREKGDNRNHIDENDVDATSEIIFNVVKSIICNPEQIENMSYDTANNEEVQQNKGKTRNTLSKMIDNIISTILSFIRKIKIRNLNDIVG